MNYKSFADLDRDIVAFISKLPSDIEVIAAIPRSGLLVGSMLSLVMNLPLTDIEQLKQGRVIQSGLSKRLHWEPESFFSERRKILVLDDSVCSGNQLRQTKELLKSVSENHDIVYGALYVVPGAESFVDVFQESIPHPRAFAWNIMHSMNLADACVDIDGILCRDPTEDENDDGARYLEFLESIPVKVRPSRRIRALVTCRLEKYRPQTEAWLKHHRIEYDELVMWNLPDKAARLAAGGHGAFKAQVFKKIGAQLFIESSISQAREIAKISGNFVLCFDTGELIAPDSESVEMQAASNRAKVKAVETTLYLYHLAAGIKRIILRR